MSSTAMSPQLFLSTRPSITTWNKRFKKQSQFLETFSHVDVYSTVQWDFFLYLVWFVGARHKDATFSPPVALVTADRPQQDVSWPVHGLFALFDVQRADVRPEHVVPEGDAQV